MLDLSSLSLAELETLVAREKAARRDNALAALQSVAASHGYALADLLGGAIQNGPAVRKNRPRGAMVAIVKTGIEAGKSPSQIAAELGYSKTGSVYQTAARLGYRSQGGKFSPVSQH